ncbi:DUF4389 domain-containing protein [Kribbella sp. NPDC049174]|uniref:DUF4389 domain-containing protein n=1 Tax=Kribbella sp. NPDC049174 TaxID=3364112 RepID=UPI0037118CF7
MSTLYPVRVDGSLDDRLNRWLWLVKWILVIPHLLILALLWIAFAVLSIVAFFAILFTGRYPRGIFDFNVGVLRWTWRMDFYAYGALGTDKYPPFTLAEVPEYPAHLDVTYPERLSRGLVLVKWWLLAIPHYLVVGFFIGGGTWFVVNADADAWTWGAGLVGLLVLVAAVALLFTGRYPRSIFDLVLGMNRWVLRVAAYAALMVDEYPPFRLDMGGDDPGTTRLGPPPAPATLSQRSGSATPPPQGPATRWSAGRVITTVLGTVVALASAFGLVVGGTMLWLDQTQRDGAGYLTSDTVSLRTTGYALVSEDLTIDTGAATEVPRRLIGDARVRVESAGDGPVFVGVARSSDVRNYLSGVDYSTVRSFGPDGTHYTDHAGTAPSVAPTDATIWRTQAYGDGVQTITWAVESGDWTIVVMSPDGTAGIDVQLDGGATVPALDWLSIVVLVSAGAFFVLGVLAVALAVPRARTLTR